MHTTTYAAHRWLLAWGPLARGGALEARVPALRAVAPFAHPAARAWVASGERAAHEPALHAAHASGAHTLALARFARTPLDALPRALEQRDRAHDALPDEPFAAAHLGPSAGATLTLARDRLGLAPLWFARDPAHATLLASPSPALLLAALGRRPEADRAQLLAFLGAVDDDARAGWLRHIERVLPGETLVFARPDGPPTGRRYAALDANAPLVHGLDAVTEHTRAALREALEPYAPREACATVLMSGGLDSTAVAALLATLQARTREDPLRVVSMVARTLPWFDERGRIAQVEAALPIAAERCYVDARWPLRSERFERHGWEHGPHPHPGAFAESYALRAAARLPNGRVVLTGLGAEACMGSAATEGVLGLLARGRYRAVLQERHALGAPGLLRALGVAAAERVGARGALAALERDLLRMLRGARSHENAPWELAAWLAPSARAELAERERHEARRGLYEAGSFAERALRATTGALHDLSLQHARRLALLANVPVAHPFFDARLWRRALQLAPEWRHRGGYDKAPLRLATRDLLPGEVCWGGKRGTTEQLVQLGLLRREAPRALAALRTSRLAALGLARPEALVRAYEAAREASDRAGPGQRYVPPIALWRAVAAERWLRALEDARGDGRTFEALDEREAFDEDAPSDDPPRATSCATR